MVSAIERFHFIMISPVVSCPSASVEGFGWSLGAGVGFVAAVEGFADDFSCVVGDDFSCVVGLTVLMGTTVEVA